MQYIAHIDQDRIQSVKEHLEGTAKISGEFAGKFGKQDWGYCNGILHDIGKYSVKDYRGKQSAGGSLYSRSESLQGERRKVQFFRILHCGASCRTSGLWK